MFTQESDRPIEVQPRRGRFWLLVIGVPLLLAGLAAVGWIASASGGLQSAIAVADAQDPNWRLEDLEKTRATPPPGQNGAERVVAAVKLLPQQWLDVKQDELLRNLDLTAQLNEQQVAAVRTILQGAGPEALSAARALIDTPRGRHTIAYSPDFIGTLLPKIQDHRTVAALLRYESLERAQAGDLTAAVADCHAGFHAGSSIGDEPFSISQLVRIACQAVALAGLERVLAQGEPPADRLAALQARLEAEEPAPLLLIAIRGERAGGNLLFENMRTGAVNGPKFGAAVGGGLNGPGALLLNLPGFLTVQHAGHLRFLNEMAEVAQRPPQEWEALLAPQQATIQDLPMLARMLAPAIHKVAEACQRNHANLRNAIVALAAERFRQQHGRWPASADELVSAQLLKAVPTDPFNGQPIKLARTADGLIVYCVGPDGTDDRGTLDRQNPKKAGTDQGFQLWDPPARRGPAPPSKPPTPDGGGG